MPFKIIAVRNASATFNYISKYGWNRLCHGDSSSLMWLSTTWCDFSVSPPCHGDDVTFPAWCDLSTVLVGLMGFQHHVTMEGQGTQHGGARWSQESCQCHDTPHEVTGKHQHHRASTNTLAGWSGRTPLRHWLLWRWIMEFLEVNPKPSPTKCSWLGIHPYLGHSKLNPRWLVDGLFLVLPHYFRFQDLLTCFYLLTYVFTSIGASTM